MKMNCYNKDRGGRGYRKGGMGAGDGGGRDRGNRRGYGHRRINNGNERRFPKFADNDYRNNNEGDYNEDPKCWPQYNNNKNNYTNNDRYWNDDVGAGILPWHRKTPIIPLVIPPQQLNNSRQEDVINNDNLENEQIAQDGIPENAHCTITLEKRLNISGSSVSRSRNNSVSTTNTNAVSNTPVEHNAFTVKIKQEKQDVIKQERKSSSISSSSESSSSEESSSSDELPEQPQKTLDVKTAIIKESPSTKTPASPLNIKLKSKTINETITSSTAKKKTAPSSSSSSSSSSSEEEEEPPTPPPTTPSKSAIKAIKTKLQKQEPKTKSSKKKLVSEEDVVCIGNLENNIILEDDSDEEERTDESTVASPTNKKSKKTSKKKEKCMICDKKGHTSFQCQMICKNCSAPYHGHRTCPQPANLNTMLQLFLEFCMQQFQQFIAAKDLDINPINSVPKPQVDSPTTHTTNKIHKQKRKQSKTSDTKTKSAKKRKISGSAKKKIIKDNFVNEGSDTDSSESEEETTESGNTSSSESFVSSKKKFKLKNKSSTKIPFSIPSFTPNPVNMPLVLNGFPTLAAGTAAVTNSNSPNNALNTLLLTQMFQNAIGSLK